MSGTINDSTLAMKAAQDQDMVRRKMEIDALRKQLTPGPDQESKLREACQGFETVFIQKLWEQMRNNVPKEGYLHSKQEAMYQSMYDHEFSKKMAEAGGIGLGDMLYEQLSQSLGASSRTSSPGVNTRLPVIPSTSSPTAAKYSGEETAAQIRPLYEELEDGGTQTRRGLPLNEGPAGREAMPLQTGSRFGPRVEASRGVQSGGKTEMAGLAELNGSGLDFESMSHDLLRAERNAAASGGEESAQEPVRAPISAYAQAFNRRHALGQSEGQLSRDEAGILSGALRENAALSGGARGTYAAEPDAVGPAAVDLSAVDLDAEAKGRG